MNLSIFYPLEFKVYGTTKSNAFFPSVQNFMSQSLWDIE